MSHALPSIREVILRRYPALESRQTDADVAELLDPVNSKLGTDVENWYAEGCRRATTSKLQFLFEQHGFADEAVALELDCDVSTLNRYWNGKSELRKVKKMQARYHVVYKNFTPPSLNVEIIEGCCRAIKNLAEHAQKVLDKYGLALIVAASPTPIDQTNFCFLFGLSRNESWNHAQKTGDDGLLQKAANSVFASVRDSDFLDPGTDVKPKTPTDLENIYMTWFPWYYVVVETLIRPGFQLFQGTQGRHNL